MERRDFDARAISSPEKEINNNTLCSERKSIENGTPPISGHFGKERTLHMIRARVDCPRIVKDVNELCASCPVCQKAGPAIMARAPLQPLPVIRKPFTRIAMDIVRPLKRTKRGNKYVLVVMDYATKWPEAFALKNIVSETIVDCQVELTDRLGIPTELLSDNGTNFISRVMK